MPSLLRADDAATTQPATAESGKSDLTNLSLEQLMNVQISTVSRIDERSDEAPGNVYVYSRDEIQNRGYRSLADLLQVVPGFTVFQGDLDLGLGVRGLVANDSDKVSLLINGQNVNGIHEQHFLTGPLNLDNVDRVEVVVGPSSLFQPANTLAATVNVITKQTEGVELISAVGNDLYYSETLMAGHRWNKDAAINFSFSSEAMKGFEAWNPAIGLGQPGAHQTGELDWPSYFGILTGQFGEATGQLIAYKQSFPELHIDGGSPLNDGVETEAKYSAYFKVDHPFTRTLSGIGWFEATDKQQTRLTDNGSAINSEQQTLNQMDYAGELGLRYTGWDSHLVQAGVQYEYDHNFDDAFSFLQPGQAGAIPNTTFVNQDDYDIGVYADDEFRVNPQWKLVGGVRADRNTKIPVDRWFPGARAGIVYEPTQTWVSKLIYTRAVRMPSALEALNSVWGAQNSSNPNDPSFAQLSNPARLPEILSTVELDNIAYVGQARLGLNIYHQELQDFITWFQPHSNGGNFRGNGVEVNGQAPVTRDVTAWVNGAWNASKLDVFNSDLFGTNPTVGGVEGFHAYTNSQGRIIGSAEYTANAGLDWSIMKNLSFSPQIRYFTNQAAAVDLTHDETIRNRVYLDSTLTISHIANRDIDLHLSAQNLLDNRRPVASPLNGDTYRPRGASFVVSMDWKF